MAGRGETAYEFVTDPPRTLDILNEHKLERAQQLAEIIVRYIGDVLPSTLSPRERSLLGTMVRSTEHYLNYLGVGLEPVTPDDDGDQTGNGYTGVDLDLSTDNVRPLINPQRVDVGH